MCKIVKVKPISSRSGWLLCNFANGEKRFVNIQPFMVGVMENLKNPAIFNDVYIDHIAGTIAWPDNLKLDPAVLYDHGIRIKNIRNLGEMIEKHVNKDRSSSIILVPVIKEQIK